MDKFSLISLWDVYGGLLTDAQREIADMYFNLDLTVSEIAEEKGMTRQAVSDCIKNCVYLQDCKIAAFWKSFYPTNRRARNSYISCAKGTRFP